MKILNLSYANGSKVSINSDEISVMCPIEHEDFEVKTRVKLKDGETILVVETIEAIQHMLKH